MTASTDSRIVSLLALGLSWGSALFLAPVAASAPAPSAPSIAGNAPASTTAGSSRSPSMVVAPFADGSPGAARRYLAEGYSQDLSALMGRVPGLRVMGPNTAAAFGDDGRDDTEIAGNLGIDFVLHGTLADGEDRIGVEVELAEARSATALWRTNFDRPFDEIFALQQELCTAVLVALELAPVSPCPEARTTDPTAYRLYLEARQRFFETYGGPDVARRALTLVDDALELGPRYVPALVLRADILSRWTGDQPWHLYPVAQGRRLQREALETALAADPLDARANALYGYLAFINDADLETASRALEKSVALAPQDAQVLDTAGNFARYVGAFEQADALFEHAIDRDPLCAACLYGLTLTRLSAGELQGAEAAIRQRMRVAPGGWHTLGLILQLQGEPEAALAAYDRQKEPEYGWLRSRALALHDLGRGQEFEETRAVLEREWGERVPVEVAKVYAWSGDGDAAFLWLDRWAEGQGASFRRSFVELIWRPEFRKLHDDPRWRQLRARAGLGSAQLATIDFAVTLPVD